MYNSFNEDEYLLKVGRMASTSGLIGLLLGIIISLIFSFSTWGAIFFSLLSGYLFLGSFWGVYNLNRWIRKYKYRMPLWLWQIVRVIVVIIGIIPGILGMGIFEHFILLLAAEPDKKGMLSSIIILLPWVGKKYAEYINYSPHGSQY